MYKKTRVIFTIFFLTLQVHIYGNWNPDVLGIEVSQITEGNYKRLKKSVTRHLAAEKLWCTEEKANLLMDLILLTKPSICVEIGVFNGSTVLPVAATLKYVNHGKIYAVDAWSNVEASKNLRDNSSHKDWWSTVNMVDVARDFNSMIKAWALGNYCIPIHSTSENFSSQIETIDFLHLDGDFSSIGSLQDVEMYLPKVKKNGTILLSNATWSDNGKRPKSRAIFLLFDSCELLADIEKSNTLLFRKR